MKTLFIFSLILTSLFTDSLADEQGKLLFEKQCMSCHLLYKPEDTSGIKAPPLEIMVPRMKEFIPDHTTVEAHINDFVLDPTERKAVCPAVDIFGLMPSMEGNVTKKELAIIAKWMVTHF